jgi:hypothetical protein
MRAQVVRDQPIGNEAIFLQKFAHQFQRGAPVSFGLDQHIEDLASGIDGSPQIDHAASNLQIGFIEMPGRVRLGAALAQVCRDHRSEMIRPAPDCLVRDRDPALRQQIFDVAEAQAETK